MYQDEQPFNQQGFGSHLYPSTLRPKSLAVPGMTSSSSFSPSVLFSFLQEPQVRIESVPISYGYGFQIKKFKFSDSSLFSILPYSVLIICEIYLWNSYFWGVF